MADYRNIIKEAEIYEQRAKRMEQNSLTKKINPPLLKDLVEEYTKAADAYSKAYKLTHKAGLGNKAKENYNNALKNTYSNELKSEIKSDIKRLGPIKESSILRILKDVDAEFSKFERGVLGIEKHFSFAISSMICLAFALLFVSPSITGYDILNIGENNLQWIGLCSFICGLVFAFLYLKKKGKF